MNESLSYNILNARVIAVIGCSQNPNRTSYHIAQYLQEQGYTIIPVHPDYNEVLGEKVYSNINDVPVEITIDIVDIFRNSEYTANMVDDIIKRAEQTDQKPLVWTQLGVSSTQAKQKAETAGLEYVSNRCLMVEHRKLVE